MEKRPYFIVGDIVASSVTATAAVAVTAWLIGGAWGMLPGMIVGMIVGMAVSLPLSLGLLFPLLGVMEVMAPCMLAGMLGGMWGGMWPLDGAGVLRWGIGTGIAVFVIIYLLNSIMTGPQKIRS